MAKKGCIAGGLSSSSLITDHSFTGTTDMARKKSLTKKEIRGLVLLLLGVSGFAIAAAIGFLGEAAQFLAVIYLVLLTTTVVPGLLAVLTIGWIVWLRKKQIWARNAAIASGVLVLFSVGQFAGIVALSGVAKERGNRSKVNCERLIPYLESYHAVHRSYPKRLSELEQFSALPPDLDTGECEYFGKANGFSLVTDVFWTGYAYYDTDTREWVYVD